MEVLYHIRPYFVVIFTYIGLKNRPYIWDWYLQSIGSCCMASEINVVRPPHLRRGRADVSPGDAGMVGLSQGEFNRSRNQPSGMEVLMGKP